MINRTWIALAAVVIVAVGIVAFVSYGHGESGTPAQRLASWAKSTDLGEDIGTLEGDGANVRRAVESAKGATAVRTVCAAMANDAQTFGDQLPSPDTKVTVLLETAYGLEYDAAQSCYRAGKTGRSLLDRSARDRAEAASLFDRVLARLKQVTGESVPTTTTTVPDLTGTAIL